jgi:hypothetical protein
MKQTILLMTCAAVLASCNKGPQVKLENATGNEVSQAVRQSGVMNSDTMIEPGLWQSKVTVQEMNIPGIPAEYADKMKQSIAEHRNDVNKHCVTQAEVKKPKGDFFGADKSCKYEHFTMGAGKIDIAMVCKQEGASQNTNVNGSYTPTTYSLDMSSNATGGGMQNGMSMKLHVDAQRVGECTGKADEG